MKLRMLQKFRKGNENKGGAESSMGGLLNMPGAGLVVLIVLAIIIFMIFKMSKSTKEKAAGSSAASTAQALDEETYAVLLAAVSEEGRLRGETYRVTSIREL